MSTYNHESPPVATVHFKSFWVILRRQLPRLSKGSSPKQTRTRRAKLPCQN